MGALVDCACQNRLENAVKPQEFIILNLIDLFKPSIPIFLKHINAHLRNQRYFLSLVWVNRSLLINTMTKTKKLLGST